MVAASAPTGELEELLRSRLTLAEAAWARHERLLAESEFREVAAAAHLQLAVAHLGLQEYAAAEQSYRLAGRAVGSHDESVFAEALADFRRGLLQTAQTKLEGLVVAAPDNRPAKLLLAKVGFLLGHFESARTLVEDAFGEDPVDLNAAFLLALLDIRQGKPGAELLLAKIRSALGDSASLRTLFARAYFECGESARANIELNAALRLDASFEPARRGLDRSHSSSAGQFHAQAKSLLQESRIWPVAANQPLLQLIALYQPVAANAERGLARVQDSLSEPMSTGGVSDPSEIEGHLADSEAWLAQGDSASAAVAVRRAVEMAPNSEPVLRFFGRVSLARGDVAAAIATYRRLLLMNPDAPEYWSGLGSALTRNLELPEALTSFQRLMRLDPENDAGYLLAGYVQYLLGELDEASVNLKRALALNPGRLEAVHYLAMVAYNRGDFQEALRLARRVLGEDPGNGGARLVVGKSLRQVGDLGNALEQLRTAATLTPESPEVHYELSRTLQLLGREAEAREEMQRYRSLRDSRAGQRP